MNVRGVIDKAKKAWQHKSAEDLETVTSRLDQTVNELAELIRKTTEPQGKANGLDRGQS